MQAYNSLFMLILGCKNLVSLLLTKFFSKILGIKNSCKKIDEIKVSVTDFFSFFCHFF